MHTSVINREHLTRLTYGYHLRMSACRLCVTCPAKQGSIHISHVVLPVYFIVRNKSFKLKFNFMFMIIATLYIIMIHLSAVYKTLFMEA